MRYRFGIAFSVSAAAVLGAAPAQADRVRTDTGLAPAEAAPAHAAPAREQSPRESVTITTNVIAPLFGVYYLEGNVRLSSRFGLVLNANHFPLDSGRLRTRANALGAGLSYYFEGNALRGWYVEAIGEAVFATWRARSDSSETSPVVVGSSFSAVGGYRFICDLGPVLDVGLGVARIHIPSAAVQVDGQRAASGSVTRFYPAVTLDIGWAF